MKLDRTLVAHVSEETEREFLGLLELERLDSEDITNSSFLKAIVERYIQRKKSEYELLAEVFKENGENG